MGGRTLKVQRRLSLTLALLLLLLHRRAGEASESRSRSGHLHFWAAAGARSGRASSRSSVARIAVPPDD
jgi:hypothetical protein